jgi:hypothetical protein
MREIDCGKVASLLMVAALASCVSSLSWTPSAHAEGSSLPYGMGGPALFFGADQIIAQYNQTGQLFRIEGNCRSSCTMLLAIRNVCVDPNATLAFHAAVASPQMPVSDERNAVMSSHYNSRLQSFLIAHRYLDSWELHPISGKDMIHKFGYRQCPKK